MKKRIYITIGLVIGSLLAALLFFTLAIDSIVKSNIESMGSDILQTSLTIDNVSVSLISGEGVIEGLRIANPEGFDEGDAVTIGLIELRMDPVSVLTDTVVVHEIRIHNMAVLYKLDAASSNLARLQENIEAYSARTEEPWEISMVIDRFLMEETSLTIILDIEDIEDIEPVTATLPMLELTHIGQNDTADTVIKTILETIIDHAAREGRNYLLEEGEQWLLDEAEDVIRDLFNGT